jgi:hypothetical protein
MLLGFKNIAFGLLLLACLCVYKTTWKSALSIVAMVYAIISISVMTGHLQGFTFDMQMLKFIYKTYVILFLLLWINKLSLLEKMYFPAMIISFTIIIVYFLITFNHSVEQSIYSFFGKYKIVAISKRTFIGIEILGIYYTSVALLIIPLAVCLYRAIFKERKKIYYGLSILFFSALLLAGTRACMFSAVFLTFLMIIMPVYKSKAGKLLFLVLIGVAMVYSYDILYQILNDKEESSLQVRSGHLNSYKKLIEEHPLILVLGEGAGSIFYSEGFGENTAQTEWSYAELIRWFGIFCAGIIVFIYVFPLYIFYRKRKILSDSLPIRIGYLFYLFIAGTNPLLLGSNGLLAMLVMYSYAFNPQYEQT